MAWFSGVLQDVRSRSSGLRERVREQAKALGRGVGYDKQSSSQFLSAQEAENRIEAEAKKLSQCSSGSEVLERWLALLRTAPRRYSHSGRQLSFKQVFLRSRGLELCLDASARNLELRQALRTYALAAPARWPESCPPPMAYARAFVALLWSTVGPTETWLQLLGTLLSSEQPPSSGNEAEEPCHTWLVQLISARRLNWQAADVADRETEILAMEEKALEGLESSADGDRESFSLLSEAVKAMEQVADSRSALAEEVQEAVSAEKEQQSLYESTVNSVASAAKALASSLSSEAVNKDGLTERRAQLCSKSEGIKERLQELAPEAERLQQEIAAAEEVQQELTQQLKQNKEHLDSLRRQRDDCRKEEEHLCNNLQRTEQKLAHQLASEEAEQKCCEASQALALAVSDVALSLKAVPVERRLDLTLQRNRRQRREVLRQWAQGQVRLQRQAIEVATRVLPSDVPEGQEEAEVKEGPEMQEVKLCIKELKACCSEHVWALLEEVEQDSEGGASMSVVEDMRHDLQSCRDLLMALEALRLPDEETSWEVVEEPSSGEAFLFGQEEREAGAWEGGLKNLITGLAARAVAPSQVNKLGSPDDPFLLEGVDLGPEARAEEREPAPIDEGSQPPRHSCAGERSDSDPDLL